MSKLTKKEVAALQGVRDYMENLENNEDFMSALEKIKENRDNAQDKATQNEKDEMWGEMGTSADVISDTLISDLIEHLDVILGYSDN